MSKELEQEIIALRGLNRIIEELVEYRVLKRYYNNKINEISQCMLKPSLAEVVDDWCEQKQNEQQQ